VTWRNDQFFRRLAYGLGGGAVDVVHTDTNEALRKQDPIDSAQVPGGQAVTYPAMRDYDTPDNLTLDHNQKMPYHEGNAPLHSDTQSHDQRDPGLPGSELDARQGESGTNLKELTNERMEPPLSQGELWDQSYTNDDQFEDTDLRLGQRAPWVAVDLDGTILASPPKNAPEYGSDETQLPLGTPLPGASDALQELASLGWRISIYTARFGDESLDDEVVERWGSEIAAHLEQNGIPFSDIWVGRKPRADYFVDDKAVHFDGDWSATLSTLTTDRPSALAPPEVETNPGTFELESDRGPLDYNEGPNDFDDPLGDRRNIGIGRPPEFEEALYG